MCTPFGFWIQEFYICLFQCKKKRPLYRNFSIPFCAKWRFFQGSICLVAMKFVYMYLTHLGTRIWSPFIHIYSKKMDFLVPTTLMYPMSIGKFYLFSNFEPYALANGMELNVNLMILQMVWNWMCKMVAQSL
jgi:hypothetical protein